MFDGVSKKLIKNANVVVTGNTITANGWGGIVNEGAPAVENFKNLLRAGGSGYPYTLLTRAGVDLATPEPYRAVIRKMNAIMDEMEAILERQASG